MHVSFQGQSYLKLSRYWRTVVGCAIVGQHARPGDRWVRRRIPFWNLQSRAKSAERERSEWLEVWISNRSSGLWRLCNVKTWRMQDVGSPETWPVLATTYHWSGMCSEILDVFTFAADSKWETIYRLPHNLVFHTFRLGRDDKSPTTLWVSAVFQPWCALPIVSGVMAVRNAGFPNTSLSIYGTLWVDAYGSMHRARSPPSFDVAHFFPSYVDQSWLRFRHPEQIGRWKRRPFLTHTSIIHICTHMYNKKYTIDY